MGLLNSIFGSSDGDERPPKPDVESGERRVDVTRYEATVEYRNGDVETFECYGIYSRGETRVKFNTNPYAKRSISYWEPTYGYNRRTINYETLSREPELVELAEDTFVIAYTEDWEWSRGPGSSRIGAPKDWREKPTDMQLMIERDA